MHNQQNYRNNQGSPKHRNSNSDASAPSADSLPSDSSSLFFVHNPITFRFSSATDPPDEFISGGSVP
jgi:hypothetical protein